MAETTGLLNRRTCQRVPGVRIPLSPQKPWSAVFQGFFIFQETIKKHRSKWLIRLGRMLNWSLQIAIYNWCQISDQPEADTCKMLDLRTNRKWTSGWGYLTYSTPHNSEGSDRQAKALACPMNPRNVILYVINIGEEAQEEILPRLRRVWIVRSW